MSIREFSAALNKQVFSKLFGNTDTLRKVWENAAVNQLNLDPASIDQLLEHVILDSGSFMLVNKGRSYDEVVDLIAHDIHHKAAKVQEALDDGDTAKLQSLIGKVKSIEKTEVFNPDVPVNILQEGGTAPAWAGTDTLMSFEVINKIKDYIFRSGPTAKAGVSYDFTRSIQRGHVLGLVARQFHEAQEHLNTLVNDKLEETKTLQKLLQYMRDLLIVEDLKTSNIPGGDANIEKLKWVIQRTAKVRNPVGGGKNVYGMLVEFQHFVINQKSGGDSKLLKKKLEQIFNILVKQDKASIRGLRTARSAASLESIPGVVELRQKFKKLKTSEDTAQKWETQLYELARKELINLTGDPKLADKLVELRGSPSLKDVMISQVVAAISKNESKKLKLAEYSTTVKQKVKADPVLMAYRKQLKAAVSNIGRALKKVDDANRRLRKAKGTTRSALIDAEKKLKLESLKQKGQLLSGPRLKSLINAKLRPTIVKNMVRPNLLNQTGRFASSAIVLDVTPRKNALEVFYTYMKYPYQTFEPGFRMGSRGYDPRRVIDQSIREIAASLVNAQFRTVRI